MRRYEIAVNDESKLLGVRRIASWIGGTKSEADAKASVLRKAQLDDQREGIDFIFRWL